MTQRTPSHPIWRLAAAGTLLASACLASFSPAQAAVPELASKFADLPPASYPAGLLVGHETLYGTLAERGEIFELGPSTEILHSLNTADGRPLDIVWGADRAMWFNQQDDDSIGRLTTGGELSVFPLADGAAPGALTLGQDLAVWFTEFDGDAIGRMDEDGQLTEFELPAGSQPNAIVSAPDGTLWFTQWGSYRLGSISLTGEIQQYEIPNHLASRPAGLLYGPDGALWITFNTGDVVKRYDPAAASWSQYDLGTSNNAISDLTIGPDGNIWFVGTHTSGAFSPAAPTVPLLQEPLAAPVYSYLGRSQIVTTPSSSLLFTTANTSTVYMRPLVGEDALRDVQVFITYRPPVLLAAGAFNIDATVVNWTNSSATDLQFELTLDEGIHFVSAELPGGSCLDNGATVSCTLAELGASEELPVRFNLTTDRIPGEPVDRVLSLEVLPAEADYQPANNRVVLFTQIVDSIDYFNDFSITADDGFWSHPLTGSPVEGLDVLGEFDNQQVIFSMPELPPHDRAWLCFDLYVNGPWNGSQHLADDDLTLIGPDLWSNYVDETRLLLTTFSNQARFSQSFPGNYPDGDNAFQSKSVRRGEYDGDAGTQDAMYHFCYQLDHRNLSLEVLFMGLNLSELQDEQWALDNMYVKILYDASMDHSYLPALAR